jgi:hypothetical protein
MGEYLPKMAAEKEDRVCASLYIEEFAMAKPWGLSASEACRATEMNDSVANCVS